MSEADLLLHIARIASQAPQDPRVEIGPGDDCAVLRTPHRVLVTVDQLIEGRHYDPALTSIDLIARKAMARGISDIAAMAGTPIAAVVSACCRSGFALATELIDAVHRWGREFSCPVVGGDLASHDSGLILSVTVLGSCHQKRGPVARSGARPGDSVWVTGALGGSFKSGRHLTFTPRVAEGVALADLLGNHLSAMIDISDGLGRDAARIARASGVRIEIDANQVPLASGVASWESGARDGEDYELLFTTGAPDSYALKKLGCTRIGEVRAGDGCVLRAPDGTTHDADHMGWDHG